MASMVYECWVGESLFWKICEHRKKQILSRATEGIVMRYDDIVVKQRKLNAFGGKLNNEAVRREYEIGLLANRLPYLAKTLGYFEMENRGVVISYLVFAYVEGKPLLHYLNQRIDLDLIYSRIFFQIKELQELAEFTHYDLHYLNVIIEEQKEQQKTGQIVARTAIQKEYKITFIDFGNAHIAGIKSMMCEASDISPAIAPGIFDPLHDYMRVLGSLMENLKRNKGIVNLLRLNNYTPYGLPHLDDYYQMGALITDFYFFAADSTDALLFPRSRGNVESTKRVHSEYAERVIEHVKVHHPGLYNELREASFADGSVKEEHRRLNIANQYQHEVDANEFIVKLGKAMASDKLSAIEVYYHTPEQVYEIAIKYARCLKDIS